MDTLTVEDRRTGRVAIIRPPLTAYLSLDELVTLESTVRSWGSLAAQQQAEMATTIGGRPARSSSGAAC
jgi:hypothetical protein